jgi:hypothetical protein
MYILEPEYQKCVIEEETWRKDGIIITRAIGWRFGQILIDESSEKIIAKSLKDRNDWDRVCVSEKFEIIDKKLQDAFQDDLSFPDDFSEKEANNLIKQFSKKGESIFEQEGYEIEDTKLFFEANIKMVKTNSNIL